MHLSTFLIVVVGLFDLVSTLRLLQMGHAEGNPLFGWLLQFGVPAFVLGKVAFLAGPVILIEWARRKEPKSAETGAWIALVFYLLIWGGQIVRMGGWLF